MRPLIFALWFLLGFVSNGADAISWVGNTHTYPAYGSVDPDTAFWVNTETSPRGVADSVYLGYSTNEGRTWAEVAMDTNGGDQTDRWHVNLPGFPKGTEVRYYTRAVNAEGTVFWDNNKGADYRLRINSLLRDVYTDKSRYDPGDKATIHVDLYNTEAAVDARVRVTVRQLTVKMGVFERTVSLAQWTGRTLDFEWTAPANDFRGYSVDVDLLVGETVRSRRSTAIDVSSDWTKFPRYGFFSSFYEGEDAAGKAKALSKFHINAIQFYDWMWQHDRLVPYVDGEVADVFTQFDGRVQSFETVKELVREAKERNMFTMAYSLIYGDSGNDDGPEHLERGSFESPWSTGLAELRTHQTAWKLWIMDVTNSDWKAHMFAEFRDAISTAGFEGVHLDNLGGAWNYKYDSDTGIPEWTGFPEFINEAKADMRTIFPEARITHNDVAEDYRDDIARSDVDIYYTEVWGRHHYQDLREAILGAKAAGDKQVVLAAYINRKPWEEMNELVASPQPTYINDASAKLLNAAIFANGGFHIELGEWGDMLVNEYFPLRTPRMHPGLRRSMRDYYDFIVRYQNFLFFNTLGDLYDGTDGMNIESRSHAMSKDGRSDSIWTVAKIWRDEYDSLSLINLHGVDTEWRNTSANPTPQAGIHIKYHVDKKAQRVLLATPDDGLGRAVELPFEEGIDEVGYFVSFTVPDLAFWNLVIIDKTSQIKVDGWPFDWSGQPSPQVHKSHVDSDEWLYTGEAGDRRTFAGATDDSDITEVRIGCDNTYVYFLIKMANIESAALPAIGIALDTDQSTTGSALGDWIGDHSMPDGSLVLEQPVQGPEQQIMFYADTFGQPGIRLWDGTRWAAPATPDHAIAVSTTDNAIEARINKNDLGIVFPQKLNLSLTSFRSSQRAPGENATYDSPDGNNDAIDVIGGTVGQSENAWTRDLSDNWVEYFFPLVLDHDGAKALWMGAQWHFPSDGAIDASDPFWLNVATWPTGLAAGVEALVSIDQSEWRTLVMQANGESEGHDLWHVNLGSFHPGTRISYAFKAVDTKGGLGWDINGGRNYRAQVNATAEDADFDGVPDWWMVANFGHETGEALDASRATDDADHDGLNTREEYLAGTDPLDRSSRFHVERLTVEVEGGFRLEWSSAAGKAYQVLVAPEASGPYQPLSGTIFSQGERTGFTDHSEPSNRRFYRVEVRLDVD